jgi:hypothetical protein
MLKQETCLLSDLQNREEGYLMPYHSSMTKASLLETRF